MRHRSGVPGLTDQVADASKVQELLERRRMIEFVGKPTLLRRSSWGIYEKTEDKR